MSLRLGVPARFAIGLVLIGAAGYYFLSIAGRTLPAAEVGALANLYLLINIIGPGVSTAIEQETNRAVSYARRRESDERLVIRRMATLAAIVVGATCVVLLPFSAVLTDRMLGGSVGLFIMALTAVGSFAGLYLVRGVLGGRQQFGGYTVTLMVEGLARLIPLGVLELTGHANGVTYALMFALGAVVAAGSGVPWLAKTSTEPADLDLGGLPAGEIVDSSWRRLSAGFGQLVAAAVLMQAMANLAPLAVSLRMPDATALAAAFAQAFVLARIPLFLFAPVPAVLLPRVVRAAISGRLADVRRDIRLILAAVAAVGLAGVLGAWVLGPWILRVLFGAEVELSRWIFVALSGGTILMMALQVIQPALVALNGHRRVVASWFSGIVCLVVVLALPGDTVRLAAVAQILGPAVVLVMAGWTLRRALGGLTPA